MLQELQMYMVVETMQQLLVLQIVTMYIYIEMLLLKKLSMVEIMQE